MRFVICVYLSACAACLAICLMYAAMQRSPSDAAMAVITAMQRHSVTDAVMQRCLHSAYRHLDRVWRSV
jgi:hypothetical protein